MAKNAGRVLLVLFVVNLAIGVWVGVLLFSAITAGTKHWVLGSLAIWACILVPVQIALLIMGSTLIAAYRQHSTSIAACGGVYLLITKAILVFTVVVGVLGRFF